MANESCSDSWQGNTSHPICDLHTAFTLMGEGDRLIIRNGTYTGTNNTISHSYHPPNGNSTNYTIIIGESPGGVLFDGDAINNMMDLQGGGLAGNFHHIQFENLIWHNVPGTLVSIDQSDYIKLLRCGTYDTTGSGQCCDGFFVGDGEYILLEDCFSYGSARKHFYIGRNANKVVVRRGVVRHDRYFLYSDQEAYMAYDSSEVEFQNCISIDGDQGNFYTDNSGVPTYANSFLARNLGLLDDIYFKGSISLGNDYMIGFGGSNSCDVDFIDTIHWDSHRGNRIRESGSLINHCTVGDIDGDTTLSVGAYLEGGDPITNSIIYNISNYYGIWNAVGNDYNALYANKWNFIFASAGPNDLCIENGNEVDPMNNSLKYLLRIEDSSDLSGIASDGEDIGATVTKRIGVSGTLWDENGWNETTNESLWPFPNENIIKDKFAEYYYTNGTHEINGSRGFAADGVGLYGGPITLTSYIWEYLGNPCPVDICNYSTSGAFNDADLNTDNIINTTEVRYYISEWIDGSATIGALSNVIDIWKNGGNY